MKPFVNLLRFILVVFILMISFSNANSTSERSITFFDSSKILNKQKVVDIPLIEVDQDFKEFYNHFFDNNVNGITDDETQKRRAQSTVNEVESSNNFVDYLKPSDISKLPVGLSKKVGNCKITIAVAKAKFTPRYAELTVFARIVIPQNSKELFFGIEGLKLSNEGGIIGDAKLVLLGDVSIPINGKSAALVLKGGFDISTGNMSSKTYVKIDCGGFKELGLAADVVFPRSLLVPVNSVTGKIIDSGYVKGSFSTIVGDWNDIIANITLPKFQIKGLKDFNFTVSNASFDFSDFRNAPSISYPNGYQTKYVSSLNPESWRGVYIKSLNVDLPKTFGKRSDTTRVSVGVSDLIIDNNGVTGFFYANNVLPLNQGSASGWKMSVDVLDIGIEANSITKAGFAGKIVAPIADTTSFTYSALITASSDYIVTVTNKDTMTFDVWGAKAIIEPNSYIKLSVINEVFAPEIFLNGKMGINICKATKSEVASNNKNIAEFKGITFQALHIKTTAPKFSAQYFGYNGDVKVANFPISISQISISTPSTDEIALNFGIALNLHQGSVNGSTSLSIVGRWNKSQGIESIQYDHININKISVSATFGGFSMAGNAEFLRNDPVYGDGFRGDITVKFLQKDTMFKVSATAVFGSTSFRYWYFDGNVAFSPGIPIFPPLNLTGFGGGAYYRMKKSSTKSASKGTGYDYVPDSTAGLGVKAAVLFNISKDDVVSGEASFEMAFNNNWGLRYVGFFGYAKVASVKLPNVVGEKLTYLSNKFNDIDNKLNDALQNVGLDTGSIIRKKMFQPTAAAKDFFPTNNIPGSVGIEAFVGIQYNFETYTLDANYDMYINAAGGFIQGASSGNRAGWARLYISPTKWYLHMGKPSDRIGVKIGIGGFSIETGAYMMIGHDIGTMPPPPSIVGDILNGYTNSKNNSFNNLDSLKLGKGFAFGASVALTTGDLNIAIFYARIDAGAGFDVLIRDYSNEHCQGSTEPIGMNGWYLRGQAYAYFQGEVGIRVKLGFIKKTIPILKLGAAALIEAALPKPTWFSGNVAGYYNVLGGLIKGSFHVSFTIGNKCTLESFDPATEFSQMYTIDHIAPDNGTDNISTLAIPEITFKMPIDTELDADLNGETKYKAMLDKLEIVDVNSNTTVNGSAVFASDMTSVRFKPQTRLDALKDYKLKVSLYFQEYANGAWVTIYKDGNRLIESKEVNFKTSAHPDTIDRNNISYTWPVMNQRNFYKSETNQGYIKLQNSTNQPYLFSTFNNYYAEFVDEFNSKFYSPITYQESNSTIYYEIPSELVNGRSYTFSIKGRNVGFVDSNANLQNKYTKDYIDNSEMNSPSPILSVLTEKEIVESVDVEAETILVEAGFSRAAISYFLDLDEMRRVLFLRVAGFSEDKIYQYINLRSQVIPKLLYAKGYGQTQVDNYMDEMYKTIDKRDEIAQMTISEETQKPLITFSFRVSDYNTFAQKINSLQTTQSIIGRVTTDVINLQAKTNTYEGFDAYELNKLSDDMGNVINTGFPYQTSNVIDIEADTTNNIYYDSIRNIIYRNADLNSGGSGIVVARGGTGPSMNQSAVVLVSNSGVTFEISNRLVNILGIVPLKAVLVSSYYFSQASAANSNNLINQRFPFIYSLPEIYNKDFLELRSKIVNYYVDNSLPIPSEFDKIVNEAFPFMFYGNYKVKLTYKLPGNLTNGSSAYFIYQNNIQ